MIPFSKYAGAGNDFVLVDAGATPVEAPEELARRICPRATGVGVDGLVLLRRLDDDLLRVRFFNPDGSEFSTCGNGSRCAARYAVDRELVAAGEVRLRTDAGDVLARVAPGEDRGVSLDYRMEAFVERRVAVEVEGAPVTGWLVQIGTPHLVVPVEAVPGEGFEEIARPMRHHAALSPEGANVDLVALTGSRTAVIRTFERGVEGETLSCGSGVMAALLALHGEGACGPALSFRTRSGETLAVELLDARAAPRAEGAGRGPGSRERRRIRLAGPARHLFDGLFPDPA